MYMLTHVFVSIHLHTWNCAHYSASINTLSLSLSTLTHIPISTCRLSLTILYARTVLCVARCSSRLSTSPSSSQRPRLPTSPNGLSIDVPFSHSIVKCLFTAVGVIEDRSRPYGTLVVDCLMLILVCKPRTLFSWLYRELLWEGQARTLS